MKFSIICLLLLALFLIFVVTLQGNNSIESFSNKQDPFDIVYTKLYDKTFNYESLYKNDIEQILKRCFKKKKNIRVLDAGCGVGRHYQYLYKKYDTTGVDKSANMLKYAKIRNPTGKFINDNLINEKMFKPSTFSHIICLSDSLYHNDSDDVKLILENFYYWLKDGGYLCVHMFNRKNLDPGPREFTQYYTDKKGIKHALTYFDKYSHDAYWQQENDEFVKYNEKFILADGRSKVKITQLYIPKDKRKIVEKIQYYGFKLEDIVDMKALDIDDIEIYIFKKIKYKNNMS